jgi:hypothetical protein
LTTIKKAQKVRKVKNKMKTIDKKILKLENQKIRLEKEFKDCFKRFEFDTCEIIDNNIIAIDYELNALKELKKGKK